MEFLSPAILIILGALAALATVRGLDLWERRWAMLSFGAHVVSSVCYWVVCEFYYLRVNDAEWYLSEATQLVRLMHVDFSRFAPEVVNLLLHRETHLPFDVHGDGGSTGTMSAIASGCVFFAGPSLLAMNIFATMFSWFGAVQLYRFAREELDLQSRSLALVGCFGVPSVIYWCSGFCKESFVVGFLGVLVLSTCRLLRRGNISYVAGVLVGGAGVGLLKPFTLFAYVFAVAAFIYAERVWRNMARVAFHLGHFVLAGAIAIGGVLLMGQAFPQLAAGEVVTTIATYQEILYANLEQGAGGSDIEIGSGEARTGLAQLRFVPMAAANAFFRPVLFEAKNGPQVGAAMENLVLTLAALQMVLRRIRGVGRSSFFRSPFLVSSAAFCLVFAVGVGLATGNLGTLSRYRMPMMPFYVTTILVLRRQGNRVSDSANARALASIRVRRGGIV